MSSVLYIQFPDDFENQYTKFKERILGISTAVNIPPKPTALPSPKNKVLTVQLKHGSLTLNESAGWVQLNDVKADINPLSKEFAVLRTLMSNDEYLATYTDLLGEKPSKYAKRNLGFVIKHIKVILGILPKDKNVNQDCIVNIKAHGYKLLT